ncbi:hypothetical protein [Edaphobacter dinghuensis]|uniref:Uncharacterized protein n=1 Tax=Edaphobacter dinghuensis TaxID=1560005 RepID=A0A917M2Z1_9BACT|nr:hypothetical protein [Edaphobacter dinghuensis]GGG75892.1 hypothetical protein GCM10011585_18460 [Edaphobacter dinghuensis]
MIRQAINCDMCGAEKQETTSHWFVAYEQGGELKLRGWESPKQSRKDVKHLCGQKCAQRLTANFTASVMSSGNATEVAKIVVPEVVESSAVTTAETSDRDDMSILQRMGYDRATAAMIEEESWAGPAKPKAAPRTVESRQKIERESFINATRVKPPMSRPFQRMA